MTVLALVEPGDEVIVLEPWFDLYAAVISLAGAVRVPVPPVPVSSAVIVVFAAMPVPVSVCPTASVPEVTAVTVKVVPLIEPVTTAAVPVCIE